MLKTTTTSSSHNNNDNTCTNSSAVANTGQVDVVDVDVIIDVDDNNDDDISNSSDDYYYGITTTIRSPTRIICSYMTNYFWPGLGLFGESYLLFSIGTLTPIWKLVYPNCFNTNNNSDNNNNFDNNNNHSSSCNPIIIHYSLIYGVLIGIIFGMISLGYISNRIGRRNGSIITSFLMCLGSFFLVVVSLLFTSSSNDDDDDEDVDAASSSSGDGDDEDVVFLFRGIVLSLFIFGIGVGGEYPLSASLASEKSATTSIASAEEEEDIIQQQHQQMTPMTKTMTRIDHNNNNQTVDSKKIPLVNNGIVAEETIVAVDEMNIHQSHQKVRYSGRGRRVQLIFANQGLGIWCNTLTMLLLLSILQIRNNDNYNNNANDDDDDDANDDNDDNGNDNNNNNDTTTYTKGQLLLVWRITYIIGALILLFVFISRILYLKESKVWLNNNNDNDNDATNTTGNHTSTSSTSRKFKSSSNTINNDDADDTDGIVVRETTTTNTNYTALLFHQHYGMRLFGASMSWLLWDISFYGNKLFQSIFIVALFDGGGSSSSSMSDSSNNDTAAAAVSLLQVTSVSFLNATIALIGYYCAAYIIELPWLGRTKLQSIGFLLTGTLFILCGMILSSSSSSISSSSESNNDNDYDDDEYYSSESSSAAKTTTTTKTYLMVSMYLLSSFLGQLGPNCTTFIIPTEIFPTEQRTYAHGICAASGKVGALLAAIVFHFFISSSGGNSNSSSGGNNNDEQEEDDQDQDDQQYMLFYICGYTSYMACLITVCFLPETNNLNLLELDLQWNNIKQINREQRQQQQQHQQQQQEQQPIQQQEGTYYAPYNYSYQYYNGPANHPDHLSLYERWTKQKQT